jgi:PsbP
MLKIVHGRSRRRIVATLVYLSIVHSPLHQSKTWNRLYSSYQILPTNQNKFTMRVSIWITAIASLVSTTSAFSVNSESTRRDWLTTSLAAPLTTTLALPLLSNAAEGLTTFNDPQHGFSISVPTNWPKSEQEISDRRKIIVWGNPIDPKTALFVAYTPVRDDFTSLASFGPVETVAQQTILPKGEFAGFEGVQAEMLAAESKKSAYFFDYTQQIANLQPNTHFRTIFTLQQGATGGAGAVLVTITLQTPEEQYSSYKSIFDSIMDSYGKSV